MIPSTQVSYANLSTPSATESQVLNTEVFQKQKRKEEREGEWEKTKRRRDCRSSIFNIYVFSYYITYSFNGVP